MKKVILYLVVLLTSLVVNAEDKWSNTVSINVGTMPYFTSGYALRYNVSELFSTGAGFAVGYNGDEECYMSFLYLSERLNFHLKNTESVIPYLDLQLGPWVNFDDEVVFSMQPEIGVELPLKKNALELGVQVPVFHKDTVIGFHIGYKF